MLPETTGRALQAHVLLSVLARRLQEESNRFFGDVGMSASQFEIMRLLWQRDNVTQSELSRLCCCARANVTGLVDRLEKKGVVNRRADPEDRRANRVVLTEEGRALAGPARRLAAQYLSVFEETFTADKLARLVALLQKLYRHLDGDAADGLLEALAQLSPRPIPPAE